MSNETTPSITLGDLRALGQEAFNSESKGRAALAYGNQLAFYVLAHADWSRSFEAVTRDKAGNVTASERFELQSYLNPETRKEGADMKRQEQAISLSLFATSEPTDSQRSLIRKAATAAWRYVAQGFPLDRVTITGPKGKRVISVPYRALHEAPKADAKDNVKTAYKALADTDVQLDGSKDASFEKLNSRLAPPVARGARGEGNEPTKVAPMTRLDMCRALLRGADSAFDTDFAEWAEYMADLKPHDLVAALAMFADAEKDI